MRLICIVLYREGEFLRKKLKIPFKWGNLMCSRNIFVTLVLVGVFAKFFQFWKAQNPRNA